MAALTIPRLPALPKAASPRPELERACRELGYLPERDDTDQDLREIILQARLRRCPWRTLAPSGSPAVFAAMN